MRGYLSTAIQPLSGGLLAGLLLAGWLGPTTARAQSNTPSGLQIQPAPPSTASGTPIILDGPRHKGPLPVLYIDGLRRDSTVLVRFNPDTIAKVEILKSAIARRLGPDEARLGVVFITTKTGEHTHRVRAFRKRLARLSEADARAAPKPAAR